MRLQSLVALIFLLPTANAGNFMFDLSAFCEIDKFWCMDQHITEIDEYSANDDYGSKIICGKGRLKNIHTHYDDGDGTWDPHYEIISHVIHDCTDNGQVNVLKIYLTSFDGHASESDQVSISTSDSKHHIKYKIDLLKNSGVPETGQQTINEFAQRKQKLTQTA